jgi:DedD protein
LGVIFWPIIFVQPEDELAQQQNIPPQPRVSAVALDAPDLAGLRPSPATVVEQEAVQNTYEEVTPSIALEPEVPAADPAPVERQVRSEKIKPEPLVIDADGVPVAWILQVASVSAADKAETLRQRLDAMGHKAYVEKISSGGRILYRVYIGPKFDKGQLEALKGVIDAEFGVSSMARRYVP